MQWPVRTATEEIPDSRPENPDGWATKLLFLIGFWLCKSVLNLLEGLEDLRSSGKEGTRTLKCPAFLALNPPKTLKSPAVAEMASHLESAAVVLDHDRKDGRVDTLVLNAARPITLEAVAEQADRVKAIVEQVRGAMLAPNARKQAPTYNTAQLMALTGLDKSQVDYRIRKGELPTGRLNSTGSRREFDLPEVRTWVRDVRKAELRPDTAEAITISVGNFKGGVTKTTTALTLAQGLSLRGHRVLVIDCDPQGSLTTLFGMLPDSEVSVDDTVLPLFTGEQTEIAYAIRPTYWDGIDLVAAASFLFSAEFVLPAKQSKDASFEFWNVLNYGIDRARLEYDVIIIDTPPALSYTTINALMASNGIIMPLPPSALDFASSAQFWDLFSDLTTQLIRNRGGDKEFAFIDILLAKVESTDQASSFVREWIAAAYSEKVLPVEIPKTAAASTASAEFGTVYDSSPGNANTRTFKRAFEAYDRFVELIEDQAQTFWRRQIGA